MTNSVTIGSTQTPKPYDRIAAINVGQIVRFTDRGREVVAIRSWDQKLVSLATGDTYSDPLHSLEAHPVRSGESITITVGE